MKIDTKSILLPDGRLPKGIDHRVAENRYPEMGLPDSLKGIGEDRVASGSVHESETSYEAEERGAIQREAELTIRQSISQEAMVKGLIEGWKGHAKNPATSD